jgi:flagellar protein FliL
MKLIIIIAVVVVLLLGGGGAAYFFRGELFGGKHAAEKPPIAKSANAIFVDLESLAVAVIRNQRIEKQVVLQVSLEVPDEPARVKVSQALPRIKDAFIRDLYDYFALQAPGHEGINVEAIKKRLKRTADAVMGKDMIRAVLIQGAVERETGGG